MCESNPQASIDVLSPEFCANPFPVYDRIREGESVIQVQPGGIWLITAYEDVRSALKNSECFSSAGFGAMLAPDWLDPACHRDLSILSLDPPFHEKKRSLINRAFITSIINGAVPLMKQAAAQLAQRLSGRSVDFLSEFAYPYAGAIISVLTGIDQFQTADELRHWSETTEVISQVPPSSEQKREIENAIRKQNEIFSAIIADRRSAPRADLISAIIHSDTATGKPDDKEVINIMNLLIGAGFTTVSHALSTAIAYLANHLAMASRLRASPPLIPAFIEELLRYRGPSAQLLRTTTRSVTVSSVTIPEAAPVLIATASANRDPGRFPSPNDFILGRPNIRDHLAFGSGPHVCIGAALARQELRVALEVLLSSYKKIACPPEQELTWINSLVTHAIATLPSSFE